MKKIKKSRFMNNERVIMTNNYHSFLKGQIVTVRNNIKKGSDHTNEVEDITRHIVDDVPTKYLKKIK